MKRYNLIKMSSPGFSLNGAVDYYAKSVLELCVCKSCFEEMEQAGIKYNELSNEEKLFALWDTDCGAEFFIEECDHEN